MEDIKKRLSPIQYAVTQEDATEPPFQNEYWNHFKEGIYVDIVSGEPLFSSLDKYDAGCGWPSFTKEINKDVTKKFPDFKMGYQRVEVRSTQGNSHLGHVFDDGPMPSGLRFCINSASLKFIPKNKLVEEGYGEYLELFN